MALYLIQKNKIVAINIEPLTSVIIKVPFSFNCKKRISIYTFFYKVIYLLFTILTSTANA